MARRTRRALERTAAFWDTSALVPLCVRQSTTPQAMAFYKRHDVVVWWATPVEIDSALARLVRIQQLDAADYLQARKLANDLAELWAMIQPSDSLRRRAMELVERYDLRAADSLQLSAALEWCQGASRGHLFLTADQRLREAALLSGFDSTPL